ncbi:MAG: hypothetical protein R3B54_13485 [Bdellovibrionota bacterium]
MPHSPITVGLYHGHIKAPASAVQMAVDKLQSVGQRPGSVRSLCEPAFGLAKEWGQS